MSIRRSRPAGSVPAHSRTSALPVWTPLAEADAGAPTPRPRPMASRSAPSSPRRIRTLLVLDREFETQSVDPMFLEPECGLAWYDADRKQARARARRAVAVRGRRGASPICSARPARRSSRRASTRSSPISAAASADAITRRSRSMSRWRRCSSPAARCGSPTIAISSSRAASSGTPSRCARGSASIARPARSSAFAADHVLDGGGLANLFGQRRRRSAPTAAIGIYDIPKVDVTTVALHSRGVTAGSMRGYGTLQTMTALEVLIDEAAAALPLDPIEFRRRNALKTGGRTMTGNPVQRLGPHAGDSRQAREASDLAAARPGEGARAQERHSRRHRRRLRHQGLRHRRRLLAGTVEIDPRGPDRHPLRSCRDGQRHRHGARQPGRAPSGRRRRRSHGARIDSFDALALVTSGDPYTMDQTTQDAAAAKSALGAGDQHGDHAPRSAPMSGRMRRPRRRASSSASGCGRRRSSCGASRRPIRARSNGRRRAGRTGS